MPTPPAGCHHCSEWADHLRAAQDEEAIIYADIDLADIIPVKQACDSAGHYARPDVFLFRLRPPAVGMTPERRLTTIRVRLTCRSARSFLGGLDQGSGRQAEGEIRAPLAQHQSVIDKRLEQRGHLVHTDGAPGLV